MFKMQIPFGIKSCGCFHQYLGIAIGGLAEGCPLSSFWKLAMGSQQQVTCQIKHQPIHVPGQ